MFGNTVESWHKQLQSNCLDNILCVTHLLCTYSVREKKKTRLCNKA